MYTFYYITECYLNLKLLTEKFLSYMCTQLVCFVATLAYLLLIVVCVLAFDKVELLVLLFGAYILKFQICKQPLVRDILLSKHVIPTTFWGIAYWRHLCTLTLLTRLLANCHRKAMNPILTFWYSLSGMFSWLCVGRCNTAVMFSK